MASVGNSLNHQRKECIFPFEYEGERHWRCTKTRQNVIINDDGPITVAECATNVVRSQQFPEGEVKEWGTCDYDCPGGRPGELVKFMSSALL